MAQSNGVINLSDKYKLVYNDKNRPVYGVSNKEICDLNGNKIAILSCDDSKRKQKIYKSNLGKFVLIRNTLYLNDVKVGNFKSGASKASVFLLLIATLLLSLTFGLILLIDTPNNDAPVIEMVDNEGKIEVSRKIAVFDSSIKPGSKGEYQFVLKNPHSYTLRYQFDIKEIFNGEEISNFPMLYKIKMNNMYIVNEYIPYDTWVNGESLQFANLDISSSSTQRFTLEWYWPFENGNDTLDTYFGQTSGEYSLVVTLKAELLKDSYYE